MRKILFILFLSTILLTSKSQLIVSDLLKEAIEKDDASNGIDAKGVLKIFEGVIYGVVKDIPQVGSCVTGAVEAGKDFVEAVRLIKKGDAENVKAGIKLLAEGIKSIPDTMKACKAAPAEIKKIEDAVKSFTSPWQFALHVGKNILINGKDIYRDISDLINAYDNQNWFRFGQDIGEILEKVFIGNELATNDEIIEEEEYAFYELDGATIDTKAVVKIFEGVIYGVIKNIPSVGSCVTGAYEAGKNFLDGVKLIKKGDSENVKDGIKLLAQGIKGIPDTMKNCKAAPGEIKKIEQLIKSFTNPWEFLLHVGKNILINGVDIYRDIEDLIKAHDSANWFRFGQDIGEILEKVFLGNETEPVEINEMEDMNEMENMNDLEIFYENGVSINGQAVIKILEGVLYGVVKSIPNIGKCVTGAAQIAKDFAGAVKDFKAGGHDNTKAGIRLLADGVKNLPSTVKACKASPAQIKKIEATIKSFRGGWSFAYHVGKNILINGKDIFRDIKDLQHAFDSQSWFRFGQDIGDILEKAFVGNGVDGEFELTLMERDELSADQIIRFMEGFLIGITGNAPGHLGTCVADVSTIGDYVYDAIVHFQKGSTDDIYEAIKDIGKSVELFPDALENCKLSGDTIQALQKFIKSFQSPWSYVYHVGKNILINGNDIYQNIKLAIEDYNSKQWQQMGKHIGEGLYDALVGNNAYENSIEMNEIVLVPTNANTEKLTPIEVSQVIGGILLGFTKQAPGTLGPCVAESDVVGKKIYTAIVDFKEGGASKTKDGIILIGQVIEMIPKLIEDCKASSATFEELQKFIKSFKSGWSYAYHVGKDILVNGKNIAHDIDSAVSYYDQKQFEQMGIAMGDAMYFIFVGSQ